MSFLIVNAGKDAMLPAPRSFTAWLKIIELATSRLNEKIYVLQKPTEKSPTVKVKIWYVHIFSVSFPFAGEIDRFVCFAQPTLVLPQTVTGYSFVGIWSYSLFSGRLRSQAYWQRKKGKKEKNRVFIYRKCKGHSKRGHIVGDTCVFSFACARNICYKQY